jgi:hypothetical protein
MAYLQYSGKLPYNDFDYIDGEQIGRMSGGYSKPMNLLAFLTPLYILSLYSIVQKKRTLIGWFGLAGILLVVYSIGHRTSLAAFLLMAMSMFFKRSVVIIIYNYYRYYLNFIIGVLFFLAFYILKLKEGLIDAIRGRIPMWQAHAEDFFQSDIFSILFGKHVMQLPEYYIGNPIVVRYDEVHNNSFRTIILFGLVGYFLYCIFMRWIVLSSYHAQPNPGKRFIIFACFIYFIFYTVTNEPFYYASVIWPILIWIFLLRSKSEEQNYYNEFDR